jgi:2-C-methyl-D-erythritol 2,4-cyclodiphosphate synthase
MPPARSMAAQSRGHATRAGCGEIGRLVLGYCAAGQSEPRVAGCHYGRHQRTGSGVRVSDLAEGLIERVGIGTDIHRLEAGGPLRLGGVDLAFDRHLSGHSDGDVVLHAVTDAILGAACLPDIGEQFPDTDGRYKGCDSRALLAEAVKKAAERGFEVVNVDVVIHAERPKLSGHKRAIAEVVAGLAGVPAEQVSIKAKTQEGLDAVGRGEAIACTCIAALARGGGAGGR